MSRFKYLCHPTNYFNSPADDGAAGYTCENTVLGFGGTWHDAVASEEPVEPPVQLEQVQLPEYKIGKNNRRYNYVDPNERSRQECERVDESLVLFRTPQKMSLDEARDFCATHENGPGRLPTMEEANEQCAGRRMGHNVDSKYTWVEGPSCSEDGTKFSAIKGRGMMEPICVPRDRRLAVQCVANVPRS